MSELEVSSPAIEPPPAVVEPPPVGSQNAATGADEEGRDRRNRKSHTAAETSSRLRWPPRKRRSRRCYRPKAMTGRTTWTISRRPKARRSRPVSLSSTKVSGGSAPGSCYSWTNSATGLFNFMKQITDQFAAGGELRCLYIASELPKAALRLRTLSRLAARVACRARKRTSEEGLGGMEAQSKPKAGKRPSGSEARVRLRSRGRARARARAGVGEEAARSRLGNVVPRRHRLAGEGGARRRRLASRLAAQEPCRFARRVDTRGDDRSDTPRIT